MVTISLCMIVKNEAIAVRVRAAATVDVQVQPDQWVQMDQQEQPVQQAGIITPAAAVANATSAEEVVNQFNLLLANMRAAGLLAEQDRVK